MHYAVGHSFPVWRLVSVCQRRNDGLDNPPDFRPTLGLTTMRLGLLVTVDVQWLCFSIVGDGFLLVTRWADGIDLLQRQFCSGWVSGWSALLVIHAQPRWLHGHLWDMDAG